MSIEALISEVLYVDAKSIDEESGPNNIEAWDSLGHINIISALEDEYEIEITPEEILEISNVRDIKKVLLNKNISLD